MQVKYTGQMTVQLSRLTVARNKAAKFSMEKRISVPDNSAQGWNEAPCRAIFSGAHMSLIDLPPASPLPRQRHIDSAT